MFHNWFKISAERELSTQWMFWKQWGWVAKSAVELDVDETTLKTWGLEGIIKTRRVCAQMVSQRSLLSHSACFFFLINQLIYLFLAVLGLHFCARAFSSCGERGPPFITMHGPLTIAASLVAKHRLQTRRFSSCGAQAQLLRGMWDLPRPGLEPVSPALAGRLSTTAPPGKPSQSAL